MPRHVPVPAVELEGDYSTWAKKWDIDLPDVLYDHLSLWVVFSPSYLYISYRDLSNDYRFAVINLDDGSVKYASPPDEHYTHTYPRVANQVAYYNALIDITSSSGGSFSVMGKYVAIGKYGRATFEIWKDGVKQWTSPSADDAVADASTYDSIGISYDGKYIIAVTDNYKIVCFEGS